MNVSGTFTNNALQLYAYEPFGAYIFTRTSGHVNTPGFTTSNSSAPIRAYCTDTSSSATFAGTFSTGYSLPLTLSVQDMSGTSLLSTCNVSVSVGAGRFLPPVANTSYVFYAGEPIWTTCNANLWFLTSNALTPNTTPYSTPSLPPGLFFQSNSTTMFNLSGTPSVLSPSTSYTIVGVSGGKISTVPIRIEVQSQRVLLCNVVNVAGLAIGTPYSGISSPITSLPASSVLSHSALPTGFTAVGAGTSSMYFTGTPTLTTASNFNGNPFTTTIYASKAGLTTVSSNMTWNFVSTILFTSDTTSDVTLYTSNLLTSNDTYFSASTYFGGANVSSITFASVPAGLAVSNTSNIARLTGTPTTPAPSTPYTFTASNGATTRSQTVNITVCNDSVNFTSPPLSTTYTVTQSVYYSNVVTVAASAASGVPAMTYSTASSLYGLTFSNGVLSGIPSEVTAGATITFTASGSLASASRAMTLVVNPEVYTFAAVSFPTMTQNVEITPVFFRVTNTLSGRSISSYSASGIPSGLFFSSTGQLYGTPLVGGSFTLIVTATTGYTSGSQSFPFSILADNVLVFSPCNASTWNVSGTFTIPITLGLTYSGLPISSSVPTLFPTQDPVSVSVRTTSNVISVDACASRHIPPGYQIDYYSSEFARIDVSATATRPRILLFGGDVSGSGWTSTIDSNYQTLPSWATTPGVSRTYTTTEGIADYRTVSAVSGSNFIAIGPGTTDRLVLGKGYIASSNYGSNLLPNDEVGGDIWNIPYSDVDQPGASLGFPQYTDRVYSICADNSGWFWTGYATYTGEDFSGPAGPTIGRMVGYHPADASSSPPSFSEGITYDLSENIIDTLVDSLVGYGNNCYYWATPGKVRGARRTATGVAPIYRMDGATFNQFHYHPSTDTMWLVGGGDEPNVYQILQSNLTTFLPTTGTDSDNDDMIDTDVFKRVYTSFAYGSNEVFAANYEGSKLVLLGNIGCVRKIGFSPTPTVLSSWRYIAISTFGPCSNPKWITYDSIAYSFYPTSPDSSGNFAPIVLDTTLRNEYSNIGYTNTDNPYHGSGTLYNVVSQPIGSTERNARLTLSLVAGTDTITVSNPSYLQYVPIPANPITVTPSNANFTYVYVPSLPRGLSLNRSMNLSGTVSTITGIPSDYNENWQSYPIYARRGNEVCSNTVSFQIVSPYTAKQHQNASRFTASVRQETIIDAMRSSENTRALPSTIVGRGILSENPPPHVDLAGGYCIPSYVSPALPPIPAPAPAPAPSVPASAYEPGPNIESSAVGCDDGSGLPGANAPSGGGTGDQPI